MCTVTASFVVSKSPLRCRRYVVTIKVSPIEACNGQVLVVSNVRLVGYVRVIQVVHRVPKLKA